MSGRFAMLWQSSRTSQGLTVFQRQIEDWTPLGPVSVRLDPNGRGYVFSVAVEELDEDKSIIRSPRDEVKALAREYNLPWPGMEGE